MQASRTQVFRFAALRGATKPSYDVALTGVKRMARLVEKASDRNGGNWAGSSRC